jgi:hypothetical protein
MSSTPPICFFFFFFFFFLVFATVYASAKRIRHGSKNIFLFILHTLSLSLFMQIFHNHFKQNNNKSPPKLNPAENYTSKSVFQNWNQYKQNHP